jgi:hypothetical protein
VPLQSEEDQALKEKLELYVVRAQDADPGVQKLALESMRYVVPQASLGTAQCNPGFSHYWCNEILFCPSFLPS